MLNKKQLKKAIDIYLKLNFSSYAILLDGGWGVGKTYLVNNLILPNIEGVDFFHISLFGLKSITDIENEIYKTFLINSNSSNSYFSDKEFLTSDLFKGARLGGVGYAVQFILKQYRDLNNPAFKLVLCIDDLERWVGDLNVCLSYINKLVEHENVKCIVLGNLSALDENGIQQLSKAREKTIRHIYRFENSDVSRIDIALNLVDYKNDITREFIQSMIDSNLASLMSFLKNIDEKNIRTLAEAMQLYEYVLRHNINHFRCAKRLAFTYFLTLLSSLILLKKYFLHTKEKETLLSGDYRGNHGFSLLSKIGYFDENAPEYMTKISKILLDTVFYRLDEISLKGVFSIIENGFYIGRDFEENFVNWSEEKFYEQYLDVFAFHQMDEVEAIKILAKTISIIFDTREISNPATLLLLAERILDDIDKGIILLDSQEIEKKLKALIDSLYESKKMDVIDLEYLNAHTDRYPKSRGVLLHTLDLNRNYINEFEQQKRKNFWERVQLEPDNLKKVMKEVSDKSFIADIDEPEHVLLSLESLNNAQLYCLSQELLDVRRSLNAGQLGQGDDQKVKNIADTIYKKYEFEYGVRASNMREIATILSSY